MKRLIEIQQKLKAPKNQYNKFGEYNFRSAEDILEAVKPLLKEVNLALLLSDDIVLIGDRYYLKATAKLVDDTGKTIAEATAFAREAESITKQIAAQITGGASSYARKYALNGLFCIDDTKDPDGTNKHGKDDNDKNINSKSDSKQNKPDKKENDNYINLAQKNELKELVGGAKFASIMNENSGRLTVEEFEKIKSEVENGK